MDRCVNNTTWAQIHALDVTTMTTADLDNNGQAELIASFPTYGVWAFQNFEGWSQVHPFEAQRIAALHIDDGTQIDLVFDFGAGCGLWTVPQQLGLGAAAPAGVAGLRGRRLRW